MKPLGIDQKAFKQFAQKTARWVLDSAEKAGVPDAERAAMDERMQKWFRTVVDHQKGLDELDALSIPEADRRQLARQMADTLDEIRREAFGE